MSFNTRLNKTKEYYTLHSAYDQLKFAKYILKNKNLEIEFHKNK